MSVLDIYLIRHGETDWNVERRIQGYTDIPLNRTGLIQAQKLAHGLRDVHFDAVWSSDLSRAVQTAQPLADARQLTVMTTPALRERGFGAFEALRLSDIAERYPELYPRYERRDPDLVLPTIDPARPGETFRAFAARIEAGVAEVAGLCQEQGMTSIAMVAHGGVLDAVRRHATGLALELPRNYEIPNTIVCRFRRENQNLVMLSWGELPDAGSGPVQDSSEQQPHHKPLDEQFP